MESIKSSENKSKFLFFYDSLVDIFQPTAEAEKELWAFSAYFAKGLKVVSASASQAIYDTSELALRAAKIHALTNAVRRSSEICCITNYPNDIVFAQAENSIKQFGRVANRSAIDFYPEKQDRLNILRDVQLYKKSETKPLTFIDLDANRFEGFFWCDLIEIDRDTCFLLERLRLVDAHD